MRNPVKIAALILGFLPAVAAAQVPNFPQTVPANTVLGRLGIGPGPVQAIPNSSLFSSGLFDSTLGSVRGSLAYRGVSGWTGLAPGASGSILQSNGAGADPSYLALPWTIAKGGTGQITAPLARASAGLNIDQYTGHGDSIYTILSTDRTVGTTAALTASRIWTLPAASAVNPGQEIAIADLAGGVTSTNTLVISRSGSDTINGGTTVTINVPNGGYRLRSDGVSKWTTATASAAATALPWRSPLDYGAVCNGTTDDRTAIQSWLTALNGAYVGYLPPGITCGISQFVFVASNTVIYGNFSTIKCINGANAACGLLLTDNPGGGTAAGPTKVEIHNLNTDGNKANRTGPFTYANIYMAGVQDVLIDGGVHINCTADCIYLGGNGTTTGLSRRVRVTGVYGLNAVRNGMSVVGVTGASITSNTFTGAGTAPGHGIDVEPDGVNTTDNDFVIAFNVLTGNGGSGLAINSGGIASVVNRGAGFANFSNSNTLYGYDQLITPATLAGFKNAGAFGTGNGTALLGHLAADALP